jgi:hypothetical protein
MPLHRDISPLHRLVVIVARGHITAEEIAATKRQIVEGRSQLNREQVQQVADLLRGAPGDPSRGPVAFVIDPERIDFPHISRTSPRTNGLSSCSAACTKPGPGSIASDRGYLIAEPVERAGDRRAAYHHKIIRARGSAGSGSPRTGLFRSRASSDAYPLQVRPTATRVFSMCRLTCSS